MSAGGDWRAALRCPACAAQLAEPARCGACGQDFDALDGVPLLMPGVAAADVDLRATGGELPTYDCAGLGIAAIDEALARGDAILELGAGLEATDRPNVVRTDAFVYDAAHLDLVADAHALPFADASFDFVFSLAVFEHLHSPWIAAREIARVLRPGGRAYTLCAFMQALHGYPSHYFNMTEAGLRRLFSDDFEVEHAGPSRHSCARDSAVPLHRMREMGEALGREPGLDWRTRLRLRRLQRATWTVSHQYQQLADRMIATPDGHDRWRDIAPAVEVLAVRSASPAPPR